MNIDLTATVSSDSPAARTAQRLGIIFVGAALALAAGGCASTKLKTTWVAPDAAAQPARKVAVLAIHDNPPVREILEGQFVRHLRRRGLEAIPTARQFSLAEIRQDEQAVAAKLREWDVDAAILLRLADSETITSQRAGIGFQNTAYYHWYDYYAMSRDAAPRFEPSRSTYQEHVAVETNVYDLAPEETLVWSGVTETKLTENADDLPRVEQYVALIVGQLMRDGVLAAP